MGLLDNVERGLEKAVRGAFSRGSTSQVQPVEIASRIRREMDDKAMALTEGRTLCPNVIDVQLSEADFSRARSWGTALAEELCDVVITHARSQGYSLQGPVQVSFTQNLELKPGIFELLSSVERNPDEPASRQPRQQQAPLPPAPANAPHLPHQPAVPPQRPTTARTEPAAVKPVLDIDGRRYSLNADSVILGRSSEADILVDDSGVSRRHLQILTAPGRATAVDLGSTNGSFLNGRRIEGNAELRDGATLTVGRTKITFRLIPQRSGAANQHGGSL